MNALDQPYDPDPLKVGDRVQVRLSGEGDPRYPTNEHYHGEYGTVVGFNDESGTPYRYYVQLDRFSDAGIPYAEESLEPKANLFARVELERLP